MELHFATNFEDVRHEQSLILLLSLTDPDIKKQNKVTDQKRMILKTCALESFHRKDTLREYVAVSIIE